MIRSRLLSLALCAFTGCVSSYHVSETDDRALGWISMEEFNRDVAGEDVTIVLKSGRICQATDVRVTRGKTLWNDASVDSLVSASNDSIRTLSYSGAVRGAFEGFFFSIPPAIIVTGIFVRSWDAMFYALIAIPAFVLGSTIYGAVQGHEYRYHFSPTRPGLEDEPSPGR